MNYGSGPSIQARKLIFYYIYVSILTLTTFGIIMVFDRAADCCAHIL